MKFIIHQHLTAFRSYIATNKSKLSLRNVHINWNALNLFSRRMKGTGHVARMGDRRRTCRVLVRRPEEREHLEDIGIDGKVILKLAFKN